MYEVHEVGSEHRVKFATVFSNRLQQLHRVGWNLLEAFRQASRKKEPALPVASTIAGGAALTAALAAALIVLRIPQESATGLP